MYLDPLLFKMYQRLIIFDKTWFKNIIGLIQALTVGHLSIHKIIWGTIQFSRVTRGQSKKWKSDLYQCLWCRNQELNVQDVSLDFFSSSTFCFLALVPFCRHFATGGGVSTHGLFLLVSRKSFSSLFVFWVGYGQYHIHYQYFWRLKGKLIQGLLRKRNS